MYDAIIIGRDLSSLIAALSLAVEGRKTVLVMEGKQVIEYKDAGYTFPVDPRPLSGLADGQTFSRFFKHILPSEEGLLLNLPMDPAFQVILSGHRVDVFQNREQLINDLIREFPEQEREINRFYRVVSKVNCLVERWIAQNETKHTGVFEDIIRRLVHLPAAIAGRFSLTIPRNGKDNAFRRIVEAQLNFLSHVEINSASLPLCAAYLLSLPTRGLFLPPGGIVAWMSRLLLAFTEHGGVLMDGYSVIRVETEREITVDLEFGGTSSTLRAKKLIVSSQLENLGLLFPGHKILPGSNRRLASIRPVAYPFCLHMGVHENGLPESMASYVIVVRDGKCPVKNHELVFLQTSLPGETDRAPKGRRAILATVYLEESPLCLTDNDLKDVAMGIIDSLETFLPFLRDNIDYLSVDQSITFSRRYQEILNRKYRTRRRPVFGIHTFSSKTSIPNVLLTGGLLRAGLGFEGEIIAGMVAALRTKQGL